MCSSIPIVFVQPTFVIKPHHVVDPTVYVKTRLGVGIKGVVRKPNAAGPGMIPKGFVNKHDVAGSWDECCSKWEVLYITFQGPKWGIKANEGDFHKSGVVRRMFTFPLTLTEVSAGGEGEQIGLKVNDIVVGIGTSCSDSSYTEVVPEKNILHCHGNQSHVSLQTDELLKKGGVCRLKVKRMRKSMSCSECASDDLVEVVEQGDLICNNCAVVQRTGLAFTGTNRGCHVNTHVLEPVVSVIDARMSIQIMDTGNLNPNIVTSGLTAHHLMYIKIDAMCDKLALNNLVATEAKEELNAFWQENSRTGVMKMASKPAEALVASCVLVACRVKGNARTLKEILAMCSCTKKQFSKVLKGVNRVVGDIMMRSSESNTTIAVIPRFCSFLGVSTHVSVLAVHVVLEIERRGICASRVSSSVAAAAILMACIVCDARVSGNVTNVFSAVSCASGAAEATIREVCKLLYIHRNVLLPLIYTGKDLSLLVNK
jgi:transcription initiation factor TFIIIB Brf1 subunit/transcription initiation factor TFIIB